MQSGSVGYVRVTGFGVVGRALAYQIQGFTATLEAAIGIFEFGTGEVRFVSGSGVFVNDGGRQHSGLGLFNRALHYWESFFQR